MPLRFIPVNSDEQILSVSNIAKEIWEQHFTPIIGEKQVSYMLGKFQSFYAIKKAINEDNYQYFFIELGREKVGYTGFHIDNDYKLFLSKLYIKKEFRGKGIAGKVISFLEDYGKERNCCLIWLTCNRNNENTLKVYEKLSFKVIGKQDANIGNGYYMNDYIMEKKI